MHSIYNKAIDSLLCRMVCFGLNHHLVRREQSGVIDETSSLSQSIKRKAIKMEKYSWSSSSALQSVFCKICMETLQPGVMFRNNNCAHAFCRSCIRRYIVEKVPVVVVRWTNALCKSTPHLSERLYCPFNDCSKLICYDTTKRLKQTKCPYCRRLFCKECMVAWHYETNCEENLRRFEERVQREMKEDLLLLKVARDMNWQRCPNCKYFVEKISGCLHVKCRCGLEFCYGCGMERSSQDCGCRS